MQMEPGGIRCLTCQMKLSIVCYGTNARSGQRERSCMACCKTFGELKRAKEGKKFRKAARKEAGESYESRNLILQSLGYKTYADYLTSDLWEHVRGKVFRLKGSNCHLCKAPATELHHNRYHKNDLTGKCVTYIHPVCRGCHSRIEFDKDGQKLPLSVVRSRCKESRPKRETKPTFPQHKTNPQGRVVDWSNM